MGSYTEKLFFDSSGDLIESSVQFGEGSGAALFKAKLSNVRHRKTADADFRFTAKRGQSSTSDTDDLLYRSVGEDLKGLKLALGQIGFR